ncbi:cytochrome P450 domain-containing protein [Rhizoctonia solani AG-1 IA]|uniref:Cytochrome P450 domain-containing protein n=1 Tax=Thanatephorus cucumeris (strain AG1-IA) TaxID=983506 RepID=L8WI42_THACA|nr:cytochrome P450 domain-containing protein [Rhizoctonia solani AG-1 IA]
MLKSFKSLAASLYGAASDTTVSAVKSFFLAMTLYPDVQAKAQSEIATYLQTHSDKRFITMDDKPHLPYVSALVRETLRWHPVLTLVGHRSNGEDDENVVVGDKTYRIPARTAVIANVWKIMHNPEVYSNPEKFIPERFLGDSPPPFPESYAFGFGRRICPGIHVAQQSMCNILANFITSKAKDENGAEIVPREDYTNDIITHPLPFVCDIKPRPGYEKWLSGIE